MYNNLKACANVDLLPFECNGEVYKFLEAWANENQFTFEC